jgi:hypothetical protein
MERSMHRLMVAALATGVAVGSTFALQTSTEFSSKVDFSKYKTWSWGQADVPANPVAEKRIQDDVETQLTAKGWTKVDGGSGDAVVSVHGVVKDQQSYDVLYQGWAPGWNWTGGGIGTGVGTSVQSKIRSGTLIIDVFDAATKTLVWRGTAEGTLGPPDETAANMKRIDMAVERLLKGFPPKPAPPAPADGPAPPAKPPR